MLVIIHGGQTGVDRGAHHGAISAGLQVDGFMPSDRRDEHGSIPDEAASHLRVCQAWGYAERTEANVAIADLVIVVAPPRYMYGGTALTWQLADRKSVSRRILVSNMWEIESAVAVMRELRADRCAWRVMIGGPRASKWDIGETVTRNLMRSAST